MEQQVNTLFPFKLALAVGVILVVVYNLLFKKVRTKTVPRYGSASATRKLPPGPRPWPVIGNLLDVGLVPHFGLMKLTKKYGPLVFVRLGSIPHVATDDPEVVREFLKVQDHIFASRPSNVILAELLTWNGQDIGFAPYGSHWRKMRKICSLELFSPKRLESFQKLRTQEMKHILNSTWRLAQHGTIVDLRDTFNWLTSNMMTRMLLGKRYFGPGNCGPEQGAKLKNMIAEGILMMNGFNISDYLPFLRFLDIQGQERRMKQIMSHINELATQLLKELSGKHIDKPENFAEVLLSVTGGLPEDVIKAVMVDMMAAGTDTPGVSTEWAMSELLKNPVLFQKVRAEIDAVVGLERLVDEADLSHFRHLKAVLKESFRLHPVGAILIPHLAMQDAVVCGYHIPKDTRVLINVFALNRNPSVWEDADTFKPERFLVDNEPVEFIDPECKLIPFGSGRRMCPAASLGQVMVLLGLAHMVHAFDWTLPGELNMDRAYGTMVRAEPLKAYAKPRLAAHLYIDEDGSA